MAEISGCGSSTQYSSAHFRCQSLWLVGTRHGPGPLVDSRNHFPPTARSVGSLRRMRSWFESSLHVPRKVCSRACQPRLYCSLRHSQHLGCLKDRETVRDAELKCSSQAGREQCGALPQVRSKFRFATFIFRAGPRVRQSFGYEVSFVLAKLLIQRHMDLAWPFAQLHPGAIADNCRQPSGHLRLSPELVQMFVGGQQRLLHRILCVSAIPQKTQSTPIKRRQTEREYSLQFVGSALLVCHVRVLSSLCRCVCVRHVFSSHERKKHVVCQ